MNYTITFLCLAFMLLASCSAKSTKDQPEAPCKEGYIDVRYFSPGEPGEYEVRDKGGYYVDAFWTGDLWVVSNPEIDTTLSFVEVACWKINN